ncbi:hypothetical protein ABD83_08915 [Bacillus xiamenensis]|nr:hypothetical protein [Bacillus xiamenensis]
MQSCTEKQLFLLSFRYAFIALYSLLIPFIAKVLFVPSPLFIVLIALFITHNLVVSIVWFYKSREIRKRQSGDLSKRGHILVQLVQRLEQLMMLGFVMLWVSEWIQGGADNFILSFTMFLLIIVILQHIQFYYVQLFFKSTSWFTYVLSLQKARPSYMARERKAFKRS